MNARWRLTVGLLALALGGCEKTLWNDPYPAADSAQHTLYSAFDERPQHLDPVRSYSANEYAFLAQIYEPPLQYHFLWRPYRLIPLSAAEVPTPHYFDAAGQPLPDDAPAATIARADYVIRIQPGIQFQPHPALAQTSDGQLRYHALTEADLTDIKQLADFAETGTRELTADDFIYQIKRLAAPWLQSPIAGVMAQHLVGFADLTTQLTPLAQATPSAQVAALRQTALAGVTAIDRYSFRIQLNGKYPQFVYWLAMPFFAPMPWEAEAFYAQPGMSERNLSLDWYPIGTGAFLLSENNPNLRMVLSRNPNVHLERYPTDGMPGDAASGILADAGKPLPLLDRAIYSLEKEDIPRWNKFLQGYYDSSGIASDAFDQAVQLDTDGTPLLTDAMREQGITLLTSVEPSNYYLGFNMLDPIVGGSSQRARWLRQAISIAVDYEEFIAIFANGRGVVAHGPLPPGIFGYRDGAAGINPVVYEWRDGRAVRRPLAAAQELMAQAGYPHGIDRESGQTLTLNYEAVATGPDDRARLNWIRKQFAKLGIELVVRSTDYNRFQDKLRTGAGQLFMVGWNADYPDPENFLFLLYGGNSKVIHQGENVANYANPEFDRLFEAMKFMNDGAERQAIIDQLLDIARVDAPWIWGFFPKSFSLHHQWLANVVPNQMANNTLKYRRLDPAQRQHLRHAWNQPIVWPLMIGSLLLLMLILPAWWLIWRREKTTAL
ncbi:peptide ABC transporter substrate-binding protein [Chromatium okenii]|uniref:ABC transporter substrate-binding protein n=1 Tax=Chromatium okenii TaxID=61644 RepID=UPI001905FEE5|nr:ABC transporter substrate-binding protein [Chromatium okenii]MBK1641715.1 peptide ABC transporter substrate-binding protein [Chromatium okenii]